MNKKEKKTCLITVRSLSNSASIGLTFPRKLVIDTNLNAGKYICEYEKLKDETYKITFITKSIWKED